MPKINTPYKFIVLHHTVTSKDATFQQVKEMHLAKGYHDVGYHYLFNATGNLIVGRPIAERGAHTVADKEPYLGHDMNTVGVGCSVIGDYTQYDLTQTQVNNISYNIKRIWDRHVKPNYPKNAKLTREIFIPHSAASFTACPGTNTYEQVCAKLKI